MENELVQGTAAWRKWRRENGFGASEAAACLDVNPYKSRHSLWMEKVGLKEEFKGNHHTERGTSLEETARIWAERELGISFKPTVRKSRNYDFMFGSCDGFNEEQGILLEIKCPERALHDEVKSYYMPQVQQLIEVFEVKKSYYVSFMMIDDKPQGKILEVNRDDEYIERIVEAERSLWHCVTSFTEPELSDRDFVKRLDIEYIEKLKIYLSNKSEAEKWKELQERAKAELIEMTTENTIALNCKIRKKTPKGLIDYKAMMKDLSVDDETCNKYRKPGSSFWEIRENKV